VNKKLATELGMWSSSRNIKALKSELILEWSSVCYLQLKSKVWQGAQWQLKHRDPLPAIKSNSINNPTLCWSWLIQCSYLLPIFQMF